MRYKPKHAKRKQKEPWSRSDKLTLVGVGISLIALIKELLA
ncbi:hypothetical protein [Weissella muntiaci]|nr:hypothetical protein [Weissella muntiaci]